MTAEASRRAEALHRAGMELSDAGDEDAAVERYLKALTLDPDRPSTLYNLGLIYKYRREWRTDSGAGGEAQAVKDGANSPGGSGADDGRDCAAQGNNAPRAIGRTRARRRDYGG
jgi:tetratricopeptide (TPR) repeat protein